jgi:site-specific recombinase XerD
MKRHPNALIKRRNWKDVCEYLTYCEEVLGNSESTVRMYRTCLNHLLQWATSYPLSQVQALRPTFPSYVDDLEFGLAYTRKVINTAKRFFVWAQIHYSDRYVLIDHRFTDSLRTSRRSEDVVKERELFTLEEVQLMVEVPTTTLTEERARAAAAFLFLSGMRASAFCSLPVEAVDFDSHPVCVRQWPRLGVQTKGTKAANTFLLEAEELTSLHEVVRSWHRRIEPLGPRTMWYTLIDPLTMDFAEDQVPGASRHSNLHQHIVDLCERAGIEPRSPHKFRHGHAVWALNRCRNLDEYKAVSQNLMHARLSTTDEIYSKLLGKGVAERIKLLGERSRGEALDPEVEALVRELFKKISHQQ